MSRKTEARVVRELRRAGFTVLNRKQWGSKALGTYRQRRQTRRFVGPADHFFAHISVTHDTGDASRDAQTIERIGLDRFGTGWSYNWGLHRSTKTIILGQPHDAAGAHTLNDKNVSGFPDNLNYWGHAIAFIGMPEDPFDEWCQEAAAAIIAAEKKHGAAKDSAGIYPHSKFAYKDCPCDGYRNALPYILRRARTVLRANEATETEHQRREARRARKRAAARAARKRARKLERQAARRQRRIERLKEYAEAPGSRVVRGRALVRLAQLRAKTERRAKRLREWLNSGPKK